MKKADSIQSKELEFAPKEYGGIVENTVALL